MDQSKEAHGAPPRKRPSTLRLTPGLALLVIFVAIAFQAGVQGTMTAWIGTADAMLFSVLAFALTATGGVKASKQHGARRPVVGRRILSVSGSRAGGGGGC